MDAVLFSKIIISLITSPLQQILELLSDKEMELTRLGG